MLIGYKRSQTGVILRVKILDSSVSTGAGKTGLTSASAGLIISTIADNEAAATVYTVAGGTIETIAVLGTYVAPTATKCRFKEVDATNHKGVYEIQLANARFAVANAKSLLISISGATGAADCDVVIPLRDLDPYDSVRAGLTALPNAAAGGVGGVAVLDSNSRVPANVTAYGGTAGTFAGGRPEVNATHWGGTAVGTAVVRGNVVQANGLAVETYPGLGLFRSSCIQVETAAIMSSSFVAGAINTAAIGSNAITSAKIADGAFTAAKFAAGAFDAVWTVANRVLTAFGFNVTLASLQPNYAPAKAGDAMTLTPTERTATANVVEAAMFNEGDATALLAAIAAKVEEFLINEGDAAATLAAIATAVNAAITAGTVGTNVNAIKTQTDKLTFNGTNVNANVKSFDGNAVIMRNGYTDEGMAMMPAVSSDCYTFASIPSSEFFHPGDGGAIPPTLHAHVHGLATEAITEITDGVRNELTPELGVIATLDGMAVGGVFTELAMSNVSVTLTQENIDAIVDGITATGLSTELVEKLAQADVFIDYSVNPAVVIWYEKGTNTEIMRKAAYDRKGNPITSKLQQLGKLVDTPSP